LISWRMEGPEACHQNAGEDAEAGDNQQDMFHKCSGPRREFFEYRNARENTLLRDMRVLLILP
jgi:hypothetical protein